MFLDLNIIKKTPYPFAFSVSPEEVDLEDETARLKTNAEISGELNKRIAQTDVNGEIAADVKIECSRCLQPVDEKLKILFSVSYITPEYYTEEKETEIGVDDLQIAVFEGDKIDIGELVREQILLNLPEQKFCREDCKGLCRKCGANRNLINCNCLEKEIDPRWSALKNLK